MADPTVLASTAAPPLTTVPAGSVVLLVDENQKRQMRNTFLFWEFATLGLGIYVGKKLFEPKGVVK